MGKSKIHFFRYQPDFPDTVIYWSLTFILFFISMIGLLEEQGSISLFSVVSFLIFIFFVFLGTRRKMILTDEQLKIFAILKRNRYQIDIEQITKISVGTNGFTLSTCEMKKSYLMLPSSKKIFINSLKKDPLFKGKIVGI